MASSWRRSSPEVESEVESSTLRTSLVAIALIEASLHLSITFTPEQWTSPGRRAVSERSPPRARASGRALRTKGERLSTIRSDARTFSRKKRKIASGWSAHPSASATSCSTAAISNFSWWSISPHASPGDMTACSGIRNLSSTSEVSGKRKATFSSWIPTRFITCLKLLVKAAVVNSLSGCTSSTERLRMKHARRTADCFPHPGGPSRSKCDILRMRVRRVRCETSESNSTRFMRACDSLYVSSASDTVAMSSARCSTRKYETSSSDCQY
mmetsp:Transcript_35151/g.83555  ORF Transcript_35151/g.83555 Transcript_35151/m.83555 type:complete len:270 (-) Transcript_35151:449-1258(-)